MLISVRKNNDIRFYVILYSVGIITCRLVCKIVLICPNITLYLKSFKMSVKPLLGFSFSITLNSSMKKVLLSRKRTFKVLYKIKTHEQLSP